MVTVSETMNLTNGNTEHNNSQEQHTGNGYSQYSYIHFTVAALVALGLCLIGFVGNIIVFWHLYFKIQRNKCTIYIINLTVADSIFIVFSALLLIINILSFMGAYPSSQGKRSLYLFVEIFYDSTHYSGMFILTAISMERCIAVFFPFWYQSYRPQNLPTIMCILMWTIGCLESLIQNLVCTPEAFMSQTFECTVVEIMTFVLAVGICLPILVISSLTLLIKIRTFKHQYPTKLYIIIITTVFCFILSVIPFNFLWFLLYFQLLPTNVQAASLFYASVFGTVLNCTLNPYIYYIVGKKWIQSSSHSIHDALQRAFRVEDEENNGSRGNKINTTLGHTN